MASYSLTNKAVEDLSEIWNYTYEIWSEKQADKYYYLLIGFCQELADNPALGKTYEEIGNAILGFKASHHIIFYKQTGENSIEVIRVLHGMMDLKNRIAESTPIINQ